jgi:hypothetical protein
VTTITVEQRPFDEIACEAGLSRLDFMKIDVEGAELLVLRGAIDSIRRFRPLILFEHGLGGADVGYGYGPHEVFAFLATCEMKVSTLPGFLSAKRPLAEREFARLFDTTASITGLRIPNLFIEMLPTR